MAESQDQRLPTGDRIAIASIILALAGGVGAVALEHAFPDASQMTWRYILFACIALGIGAAGYLIFDLVIRPRWASLSVKVILGITALCVLGGAGYIAYHWPTRFLQSERPSSESPPEPTVPLLSRLDHFILNCDVPLPPPGKTVTDTFWELHDYKQKLDVYGDTIGVTFTMETIRGGVHIEAEATTEEAKRRIPLSSIGVTKITLEIRRINKYELVSVIVKLPPQYAFYGFIAPNPAAPDSILVVRTVEGFLGVQRGSCRIV